MGRFTHIVDYGIAQGGLSRSKTVNGNALLNKNIWMVSTLSRKVILWKTGGEARKCIKVAIIYRAFSTSRPYKVVLHDCTFS